MGAEGIGLCRTEHMFFDTEERRLAIQEMIVAETLEARKAALAKLLPFQQRGLRRHLQGHERQAGDHPPDRPAAARVHPQG